MSNPLAIWIKERWRDAAMWPINMVRDLPPRLTRLAACAEPRATSIMLLPGARGATGRRVRLHRFLACLFDLLGGPEIAQYLMHFFMVTSPLSQEEMAAIHSVLGPRAIRYQDVRIAESGILPLIFRLNGGRAFCTWHTIHLPREGKHTRADLSLLVHEATHVFQYEQLGTSYIGEALYAQRRLGRGAYDYGGAPGLQKTTLSGLPYLAFNREAQAQIAQDYYRRREAGADVAAYETYVSALRAGDF